MTFKLSRRFAASVSALACASLLAACDPDEDAAPTPTAAAESVDETVEAAPAASPMDIALAGEWRVAPERDASRHPKETLAFFGVEPDMTVVEIWPGGGWYTSVLAPYLKLGGGTLVAAAPDPAASDYAKRSVTKFTETFIDNADVYGDITLSIAAPTADSFTAEDGTADVVLTFRNVHNWMMNGFAEDMFAKSYKALKPGGVLGVVEHRLPSSADQDAKGMTGYVQESLVRQMAEEVGFEFAGSSEINANPKDTADHPFGVWTLPPNSRSAPRGGETPADFDPAKYLAIGESDRMTLKFVKPMPTTTE